MSAPEAPASPRTVWVSQFRAVHKNTPTVLLDLFTGVLFVGDDPAPHLTAQDLVNLIHQNPAATGAFQQAIRGVGCGVAPHTLNVWSAEIGQNLVHPMAQLYTAQFCKEILLLLDEGSSANVLVFGLLLLITHPTPFATGNNAVNYATNLCATLGIRLVGELVSKLSPSFVDGLCTTHGRAFDVPGDVPGTSMRRLFQIAQFWHEIPAALVPHLVIHPIYHVDFLFANPPRVAWARSSSTYLGYILDRPAIRADPPVNALCALLALTHSPADYAEIRAYIRAVGRF